MPRAGWCLECINDTTKRGCVFRTMVTPAGWCIHGDSVTTMLVFSGRFLPPGWCFHGDSLNSRLVLSGQLCHQQPGVLRVIVSLPKNGAERTLRSFLRWNKSRIWIVISWMTPPLRRLTIGRSFSCVLSFIYLIVSEVPYCSMRFEICQLFNRERF